MSGTRDKLKSAWVKNGSWLDGIALAFIFLLVAATLGAYDLVIPALHPAAPLLDLTSAGWLAVFGLIIAAYMSISWARGAALWTAFIGRSSHEKIKRDKPNPFSELFIYLIIALLGLAGTCFYLDVTEFWQAGAILGGLAGAFLPPLYWFMKLARKTYPEDDKTDHISNQSVVIGLGIVTLIGLLAWVAGSGRIPQNHPLFGVWILGFVLTLFLMFIAVPYVYAWSQRKQPGMQVQQQGYLPSNPAGVISAFDGFLVRSLAPLTGAIQHSKNGFPVLPHLLLIAIFLPLTALGFAMPAPYGLVPIGLAALLAIALGRRWAWVEDDRETAMRIHTISGKNIRIGFLNDLRDEALLGYAFLFMLIPLALRQLQMSFGFFEGGSGDSVFDWVQFFGIELAKGVPIVDWADIYGVSPQAPFEHPDDSALSRHLVFGSRLMVDIVIIAALLQAWGIVRRNSDQLKLFKDGQLDVLDPFAEKYHFIRGVTLDENETASFSPELEKLFATHADNASFRHRRKIPYDERRLTELLSEDNQELVAMVKKLAHDYSLLVGNIREQIMAMERRWREKSGIFTDPKKKSEVRDERIILESLLDRVTDGSDSIVKDQVRALRFMQSLVVGKTSFGNVRSLIFEILAGNNTIYSVKALAAGLLPNNAEKLIKFRNIFTDIDQWNPRHESWQETRIDIVKSIGKISANAQETEDRTRKFAVAILEWAADNETVKAAAAAKKVLEEIKAKQLT